MLMKRPLLVGMMGLAALCANAQTTAETAKDLIASGENTFTQDEAKETTVYFKYTAPSDGKGQLLTITKNNESGGGSFTASVDGTTGNTLPYISADNGMTTIIPVKAGQTIYVIARINTKELKFTASVKDANVDGSSIATAVEATKERFVVPVNREGTYNEQYQYWSYNPLPTYIKYTAQADDVLKMSFEGYVANAKVREGENGEPKSFDLTSNYNQTTYTTTYEGKLNVKAGQTYYISCEASNPLYASFEEVVMKQGSSYDLPFEAVSGANTLPKETGKYWYKFTADKAGFGVISSEAGLPGGTIKVYSDTYQITSEMPAASVSGQFALRFATQANQAYYVCIEKAYATDADETFDMTIEAAKAGDTFDNPIALDSNGGTQTVPESNGTYYYKLVVPAGKYYINVNAPKGISDAASGTNTNAYLYNQQWGSYSPMVTGRTGFRQYVENSAETTYIIAWQCDEGTNGFAFNYSLDAVSPGDVATDPIAAVDGENELANGTEKYYSYTPAKSGWLNIDTEVFIDVTFPTYPNSSTNYDAVKSATVTKTKVQAGTQYLIKFTGMKSATTFDLSLTDFAKGESADNPIEVAVPAAAYDSVGVALPQEAFDRWYSYVAPKSGKLTITTDMTSGSGNNQLLVKVGKDGTLQNFKGSVQTGTTSEDVYSGSVFVKAGDVVYVNLVLKDAQKGKHLSFVIADPLPGEDASNPIKLTDGDYTFGKASRTAPLWYCIEVDEPCVLNIASVDGSANTYFGSNLYATDGDGNATGNPVAYANSNYDYTTGKQSCALKYVVNGLDVKPGKYILEVFETYGDTPVTISKSEIEAGSDASKPITLEPGSYTFGASSYSDVHWYRVDLAQGEFKLATEAGNTMYAELYATDGSGVPSTPAVAYSSNGYDESTHQAYTELTYNVDGETNKAGTYLIKVNQANEGTAATLTFEKAVVEAIGAVKANGAISVNGCRIEAVNGDPVSVFDLTGRIVANGQGSVNVPKGIYVVRTQGGKSVKISVK